MKALSDRSISWLIAVVALVLFVPGLGAVHLFDWDEINFAEIAREMLVTHDWLRPQVGYLPFHEKPPLFMWLQALSMAAFGVNEFAARLPDAVCGVITLLVLFRLGERMHGRSFGLLWVLAYAGSILPHLYFRSGIIDPWFNLFIFLGLMAVVRAGDTPASPQATPRARNAAAAMAGLWCGLAILTKGPVGLLIPALCIAVYQAWNRFRPFLPLRRMALMLAMALAVPGLWFGADLLRNGPGFITAFFWRQVAMLTTDDAGHGGFLGYHFVVLLIGCFPASVFAVQELVRPTREGAAADDRRRWMVILFWTVLLLFTVVRTKIVHYSSLCYFPLTWLAALQLRRLWQGGTATLWSRLLLGAIGTLYAVVTLALPFLAMHPERLAPFVADPFARANLQADVHWTGLEAMSGLWMAVVLFLCHRAFSAQRYKRGIVMLFGGAALFVTLTLGFFIRRIEGYSQGAAVAFFEQRQGQRCYVRTLGYKSYAPLFYARMAPPEDPRATDGQWLLHGPVDRPVYVACKVTALEEAASVPGLKELYRRNGFVFFRRDPP